MPGSPRFNFGNDCARVLKCDFSGAWAHVRFPSAVVAHITVTGNVALGVWDPTYTSRPDFAGTVSEDGCTVDMTFPDDLTYRGTYSPAMIQWSVGGVLNAVDPDNQWVRPTP